MPWALQDCDRVLKLGERRKDFGRVMKKNFQAEKEMRKEVKRKLETQGVKLQGARAELKAAQTELAQLKETSSKCREDTLMEISWLQARVDTKRKLARVPEELTVALAEYQSLAEFDQVQNKDFDEGVHTFIYNVWRKHPEWNLSFLGEAAREMVAKFNEPPETLLADPPVEFVPPAD